MAQRRPDTVALLDATLPAEEIGEQVYRRIMKTAGKRREK
jgi:hypothetical protein